MRRWAVVLSAVTISLGAVTTAAGTAVADPPDNDPYTLSNGHAGPMAGIVPARDANGQAHGHGPGGGGSTPLLTSHGGPVQHGTTVKAIFWGGSWATYSGDKFSGLDSLYNGLTTSNYARTNGEYYDGNGNVVPSVSYLGHTTDTSAAPSRAPQTSAILNEVVKVITPAGLVDGGYYPVYIDQPRGSAGYCAWHSAGTVTYTDSTGHSVTKEIQFGFFFNLDGDAGCDPKAPSTLPQSQGLSALGNVTGHEYSEMVTDPQLNAWYDSSGAENADKCAWTFGSSLLPIGSGTDSSWKIQGNWSNNAAGAGTGYLSGSTRVVGCIDGTNA